LYDDSPPKPKKKSRELAGLETLLGEAWKPPAEGNRRNRDDKLAEFAQLALEDEEFRDMIPIYAAAANSNNHDHQDGIHDPKSDKAATESPLADKWDTVMKDELDAIGQNQVFGDFVQLPEGRKALPSHWVYKIKPDEAGNIQRFKARLHCGGNHQIKDIDYQATYARLLAGATLGWHTPSPPSTFSESIKWTSARLSSESTWKKRFICTRHRDTFVWSLGADSTIQE
jgi:hypothetical protein